MNLNETLLQKRNDSQPTSIGRHSWSHSFTDHGWTVTLATDQVDTVGSLLWELSLQRIGEPVAVDLKQWASRIASQVTGLMEPLTVHEVDATSHEAILRSESPAKRGESKLYYEVRLTGDSQAVVRRYQYSPDVAKRVQVAFALTHEAMAKLASDIAGE